MGGYTILPDEGEAAAPKGAYKLLPDDEPRGYGDSLARGTGLAARAVGTAAMSVPNMVGDAVNTLINFGLKGANALGADQEYLHKPSEVTQRKMTDAGLPSAETGTERVVFDHMAPAVLSGGFTGKLAEVLGPLANTPMAQQFIKMLSSEQGMQAAGNATGAAAGGVTAEAGGGPVAQLIAQAVGGVAPAAVKAGGAGAVRVAARGGEEGRQVYNERLSDFQDAGVESPSAGQAAGNRRLQAVESTLTKTPGGAGPMIALAQKEAEEISARVNKIADDLIPKANATKAGTTIESGIRNFVQRFTGEQKFLYDKLDKYIPGETQMGVSNTRAAMAELNADIPGAPELSKFFKNAKIQGIEGALEKDLANPTGGKPAGQLGESHIENFNGAPSGETLPYQAIKKLRTLVGKEITNTNIASEVPRDKWTAVYAALSKDLEAAAQQAGPDATKAFERANWYTSAGHKRVEEVLDRVVGNKTKTPEAIYDATVNPSEVKEGATTTNAVMKSLLPEERAQVTAATIKRLGRANPGHQNADGDAFSTDTFLTNWNKFSPDAKRVMFVDDSTRQGLDDIAKAAERIKAGSKVFSNSSGTSGAIANYSATTGMLVAALTGHPGVAAGMAAGVGAANVSARLMTNPAFVEWLGKSTRVSPGALPAQLNLLVQDSRNWAPEDRAAVDAFVKGMPELPQSKVEQIPQ